MAPSGICLAACGLATAAVLGLYTVGKCWWHEKRVKKEDTVNFMGNLVAEMNSNHDVADDPEVPSGGNGGEGQAGLDLLHSIAGDMVRVIPDSRRLAAQRVVSHNVEEAPRSPKSPRALRRPAPPPTNPRTDFHYHTYSTLNDNDTHESPSWGGADIELPSDQIAVGDRMTRVNERRRTPQHRRTPTLC